MRHASTFTGIGGFDKAAELMGWQNVFQVENDPYCISVLNKNFPTVKKYGDIKTFDAKKYFNSIDVLTGGFPCQDLSVANSTGRNGLKGNKSGLYKELIRIIREVKPTNVIIENVYGIVTQDNGQAIETLCADLETEGYQTIPLVLFASAFGANHHRKRFFAYSTRIRDGIQERKIQTRRDISFDFPRWNTEPSVCRVYDGVPAGLDKNRLRALGNAVPVWMALDLFQSIH